MLHAASSPRMHRHAMPAMHVVVPGSSTLVRFSTQSSMARCTSSEEVRLLKLRPSMAVALGSSEASQRERVTVLAVPDSPTSRHGLPAPATVFSSQVVL